jgi:nifR3 family TIM-barrel protein
MDEAGGGRLRERAGGPTIPEAAERLPVAAPFRIGSVVIDPPVVLAPMADVTNGPFRRVCKRIGGPGLLCTEQISVQALRYGARRAEQMLLWTSEEQPLSVQLFGSDPFAMAEAARRVADGGASIVDINMGCWVPKVCKTGAGAALLRTPEAALRVVEAVVRAVALPVTVKMRAGWTERELAAASFARRFEEAGVQGFTLHGRTAVQGFEGSADWRWIAEVKQAVRAPVIGNGDIREPEDAVRMFRSTACDGVMIGRAAIGNPWLLRDVADRVRGHAACPPPSPRERMEAAMDHARQLADEYGEEHAVVHLRGQLPHYVKGLPGARSARDRIVRAHTLGDVEAILADVVRAAEAEPAT